MSRPKLKRRAPATWWDWTPDVAALFGMVPDGWTPPNQVRVHRGKAHVTLAARFRTGTGHVNTARVRLERDHHAGGLVVVARELTARFHFVGRPAEESA